MPLLADTLPSDRCRAVSAPGAQSHPVLRWAPEGTGSASRASPAGQAAWEPLWPHLVGSSKNMTGGLLTSSRAMARRLRCPPDRQLVRVYEHSSSPSAVRISFTWETAQAFHGFHPIPATSLHQELLCIPCSPRPHLGER